jgi:hypothetical protein
MSAAASQAAPVRYVSTGAAGGIRRTVSWTLVAALALPIAALVFAHLYRPAKWTMSVIVETSAVDDTAAALRDERRIVRDVTQRLERDGLKPAVLYESTAPAGPMTKVVVARRIVSTGSDDENRLNRFASHFAMPHTEVSLPRRTMLPEDAVLPLLLVAMLLGFASFERSASWNSDAMGFQAGRPAVIVVALGITAAAGAIAVVSGARGGIAGFVAMAFLPVVIWLAKSRATWVAVPPLARIHTVISVFAIGVALEWAVRLLR